MSGVREDERVVRVQVESARRMDVTQDEGSYDRYLDQVIIIRIIRIIIIIIIIMTMMMIIVVVKMVVQQWK